MAQKAQREQLNVETLAQLMRDNGFSNKSLAGKAKVDPKTIDEWLAGKRQPHRSTLCLVAKVFGVPASSLVLSGAPAQEATMRLVHESLARHLCTFEDLIQERTEGCAERVPVFEAWAQFLRNHPSGYFAIEGKPGTGKTTLLAMLINQNGFHVHHFNSATRGITSCRQSLGNICGRLIQKYNLEYTDLPPDFADSGAFFYDLLGKASAMANENAPVVVVIDALDEASLTGHSPQTNILFLPETLPKHVYCIISARSFGELPLRAFNLKRFELGGEEDDILKAIRSYIATYARRRRMSSWIKNRSIDMQGFVEEMAKKSEGNFMYLRYVLPEIESGSYSDLSFDSIPQGLDNYYADHWRRMGMMGSPRPRTKLRIIYCLSKVRRPVSCNLLAEFSKQELVSIQEVLDEWLQFLRREEVDNTVRYSFYHASFRDFLFRKEIVRAAGVNLAEIDDQIADDFMDDLAPE